MAEFCAASSGVLAIDGKTVRQSFNRAAGASPLHLVSAWAADQRLVVGQMKVAAEGNEITAVLPDVPTGTIFRGVTPYWCADIG